MEGGVTLTPTVAGVLLEDGVESIGFGEFIELPDRTLIISRLLEPTPKDVAAGEDAYALVDENGGAVYSPFRSVRLDADVLDVTLTDEAQEQLGLPERLVFQLRQLDSEARASVALGLTRVITDLVSGREA